MDYEATIGMEIHTELATKTKMFCGCLNSPFGSEPNTNICPVCLALPGSLPVINEQAVEWTLDLGADLGATIAEFTKWDRKNYFYPDLPKGYQLSQYDLPLLSGGAIEFIEHGDKIKKINLTRIHLEEDTGKLVHANGDYSLVDYNRAGVPLLELVTEPEITSSLEAKKLCQTYQFILRRRGIANADMEKGEMRCEANISVRPKGHKEFGTKVEVKNLNSFKAVERAIEYEIKRQIETLEVGEKVIQETRGWDDTKGRTFSQRSKETAADYRYFPDPDLPPVTPHSLWDMKKKAQAALAFPHVVATQLKEHYGLSDDAANLVTSDSNAFGIWTEIQSQFPEASNAEHDLMARAIKLYANFDTVRSMTVLELIDLGKLVDSYNLSQPQIRSVIEEAMDRGISLVEAVKSLGFDQVVSSDDIEKIVSKVISDNPDAIAKYRAGEMQVLGFLIGEAVRRAEGKANPREISGIIRTKLDQL